MCICAYAHMRMSAKACVATNLLTCAYAHMRMCMQKYTAAYHFSICLVIFRGGRIVEPINYIIFVKCTAWEWSQQEIELRDMQVVRSDCEIVHFSDCADDRAVKVTATIEDGDDNDGGSDGDGNGDSDGSQ